MISIAVMFLMACEPKQESNPALSDSPNISYLDIVNNKEFSAKLMLAVQKQDHKKLKWLQDKALEIATEARFSQESIGLFQGEQGLAFLNYHGKRKLFTIEFQQAYNQLESITPLAEKYPEASDLYAKAELLVHKRNQIIVEMAKEIAPENENFTHYLPQAKKLWLNKQLNLQQ